MKTPALFAVFVPWILYAISLFVQFTGQPISIFWMALLWQFVSPVFIAGCILVAYREGQWSKK